MNGEHVGTGTHVPVTAGGPTGEAGVLTDVRRPNATGKTGPDSYARMTWLRTRNGRALAVRVDEPADGQAIGALVIVPSFGRESTVPFRRLRALAVRAADRGYVTVSVCLGGDGESQDLDPGADLVGQWLEEVDAAVAAAAAAVPGRPVNVAGWRLGASLAHAHAQACQAQPGLAAITGRIVLWEPASGSSFLRQHQNLRKFATPVPPVDSGVELCGVRLSDAQAASLSGLPGPRAASGEREHLIKERDRKEVLQLTLGSPHHVLTELPACDEIISHFLSAAADAFTPVPQADVATWRTAGGDLIEETFVVVGPHRLPGVVTRSPQAEARTSVVYTAIGSEMRSGPGNCWTETARALAPSGVVGLRMDRRFLGEDTDVTSPREPYPYTETSVEDVVEAAGFLEHAVGAPVLGVGACSGAWCLMRGSASGKFSSLLAINPIHWDPDPEHYDEAFYERTYQAEGAFAQTLDAAAGDAAGAGGTSGGHPSWRVRIDPFLHELAIRFPRLRSWLRGDLRTDRVPAMLRGVPAQTTTVLVMGTGEAAVFRAKGGMAYLAGGRRAANVRMKVDPGVDHSLFAQASRDRVEELVTELTTGQRPAA